MSKKLLIAALPFTVLSLTGCQALFGNKDGAQMVEVNQSEIDMTSYYAQRLAAGRHHLERGQLAAAATAFRQASYHPEYAAQAYNGMAVAYDRIGRADLAERFFTLAIKTDPAEGAYARNFALFRDRHPLAPEAQQGYALQDQGDLPVAVSGLGAGLNVPTSDARIERLSNREVRLRDPAKSQEAQIADARAAAAAAATTRAAEINVQARAQQLAEARQAWEAKQAYPLRVEVAEQEASESRFTPPARPARRIVRSAPSSRSYPLRVEMPTS